MTSALQLAPWYTVRTTCRVCDATLPDPYLDLGMHPLANAFRTPQDRSVEREAPLAVAKCGVCDLSQLTVVVDPEVLYPKDYAFTSGTSTAWHEHCQAFADSVAGPGFVIDVAANDGTCLAKFRRAGWNVLGVDPARLSTAPDLPFVHEFWSERVAEGIVRDFGTADLIVAQNVLGHVDDPRSFLRACEMALSERGRIVVEVPHVGDLLDSCAFDTIYHEHLSYWSLVPLEEAAQAAGLVVVDVEHLSVHGGSRRYWLAKWPSRVSSTVVAERAKDEELRDPTVYGEFRMRVLERLALVKALLESVASKRMWAFGASAKGTVMLNALCLVENDVWPTRVIDDTPGKVGKRVPGMGIQVLPMPTSLALVDVLWLMSWNWTDTLMRRAREHGFRGTFLVTHPRPRLLDG